MKTMALFTKKKNEYSLASSDFNEEQEQASDRILMEQIEDEDDVAASLVDKMKNGNPLVLNFELLGLMEANKFLAFFTGACYAINGKVVKINETTYMFARSVDFLDGSLKKFIESI